MTDTRFPVVDVLILPAVLHPAAASRPLCFRANAGASPGGDRAVVNGASGAVSALAGFHPLRRSQRHAGSDRSDHAAFTMPAIRLPAF
ncbi:hypothetical protein FN906_23445 [Salmonella enterica subsp. enterica]|nr:hypothetical protein [Salmonella enterica subsp. enterica serovar Brazzaville]